jgi:G protein-coupled receptor 158
MYVKRCLNLMKIYIAAWFTAVYHSAGTTQLRYNQSQHGEVMNDSSITVTYEDGHWSKPYFDCGGGDIWMMTYTVPFFGYKNGTFKFK